MKLGIYIDVRPLELRAHFATEMQEYSFFVLRQGGAFSPELVETLCDVSGVSAKISYHPSRNNLERILIMARRQVETNPDVTFVLDVEHICHKLVQGEASIFCKRLRAIAPYDVFLDLQNKEIAIPFLPNAAGVISRITHENEAFSALQFARKTHVRSVMMRLDKKLKVPQIKGAYSVIFASYSDLP